MAPFVIGVNGGISPLLGWGYAPDARTPDDLSGVSDQSSLNAPLVSIISQRDQRGSYSYMVSPGFKGLASVSSYPVRTWTGPSVNVSAIQKTFDIIQAQINSLKTQIDNLLTQLTPTSPTIPAGKNNTSKN
jgi:hypothetical protein